MKFHMKYLLVESGELFEMAQQFRADYIAKCNEIAEYVKGLGGISYQLGVGGAIYAVKFPKGEIPEGFKKPAENGHCEPYKRSPFHSEFANFRLPNAVERFQAYLGCPLVLRYRYGTLEGSRCIGHLTEPIGLYWYAEDGPLLLAIPDVGMYASQIRGDREDVVFEEDREKWVMTAAGAREILKEEWDLMAARHKRGLEAA